MAVGLSSLKVDDILVVSGLHGLVLGPVGKINIFISLFLSHINHYVSVSFFYYQSLFTYRL